MPFSIKNRKQDIKKLKNEVFDLIIIGGGATGAGALLDAQSRGLKACLIEMQDFSQGTSSRSTKLVHGGLRYLKQRDFKLVAEVGKERNTLYKNAPHLTQPTEVIVPFIEGGSMGRFTAKLAMIAYEWLAEVERRFKHKMLRKVDVYNLAPNIRKDNLKGGVIYYEYKTNDSRLVIELLKKAHGFGAIALNYIQATAFGYTDGQISSVKVKNVFNGEEYEIQGENCISATGPWTDEILKMDKQTAPNRVVLTKGIHIVFSKDKFDLSNAIYFEVGDGRMVFAIPKFDKVYIGTTDTFYSDEIANPSIQKDDVQYVIDAIHNNFGNLNLTVDDVIGAWSGLRPLIKEEGKGESEISRKDEIFRTDSGIIAIAGGKLTGYRKMAEKVVDLAETKYAEENKTVFRECVTEDVSLLGFDADRTIKEFVEKAVSQDLAVMEAEHLYHWFGAQAYDVLKQKTIENLPEYLGKSLVYSSQFEMITNPIDFLIHRTQVAYYDLELALKLLPFVYQYLETYLGDVYVMKPLDFYREALEELKAFKK